MGRLVYVHEENGTETWVDESEIAGASPAGAFSWCRLSLVNAHAPTLAASGVKIWRPGGGDITIEDQDGTDFSLNGDGQLISASGGWFQAAMYVGSLQGALDAGSSVLRELWVGAVTGDDDSDVNPFRAVGGLDVTVRIDANGTPASVAVDGAAAPGYCAPGGTAFRSLFFTAQYLTGTDTIAGPDWASNIGKIGVWKIGPA